MPIYTPVNDLVLGAKTLADPTRVRILAALREGELCVCELCDALAITQSTLSTHLQVIRNAGLVSTRKEGRWMYYALEPEATRLVDSLFAIFSDSLKQDARLRRDARALSQRLALREGGQCCVGFARSRSCHTKESK